MHRPSTPAPVPPTVCAVSPPQTAGVATVGSLFSGVGGFDLGFERAGFDVRWQCEIDPQCQDVLRRNFPETEAVFTNVCTIDRHMLPPVDIICGGFPCQDISVAGRRKGLAGSRSGLWWEFHRIIRELSPQWVVIENVRGLLSSGGRRDMGAIVGALGQLGYGWAYRVFDAQYDGVAQRRERVFIVGHRGDGRAAEVLFEPDGVYRDSPPRRSEGEADALAFAPDSYGGYREGLGTLRASGGDAGAGSEMLIAYDARNGSWSNDVTGTLQAKANGGYSLNYLPIIFGISNDPTPKLATELIPPPATKNGHAGGGGRMEAIAGWFGVRRLTPREAERLQGFSDDWTRYGASGKEMSDSTRYRMMGNAVCVPVAEWIARRIREAL